MFVVSLKYLRSLDEVDALLPAHVAFLEEHFQTGVFLMAGRKMPRTGGIIIANADSRAHLDSILAEDPFHKMEVAQYDVTEFLATRTAMELSALAEAS